MKIGILTHYYGSNNYGGLLQAYALVKVLRDRGYDAEQICYNFYQFDRLSENKDPVEDGLPIQEKKRSDIFFRVFSFAVYSIRRVKHHILVQTQKGKNKEIQKRKEIIRAFAETIEHSDSAYTKDTIHTANEQYDAFIVGSDQVWNFEYFNRAFFLEFVKDKKKIAYAASAGGVSFSQIEKEYLSKVLPSFSSISVRENVLCDTLSTLSNGKSVEWVLDPVLLLPKEEWDNFAAKSEIKERNYLFCYFLGKDENLRILAKKIAKELKLTLVSIPFLGGQVTRCDRLMGGRQIIDASPYDFVSLIKNSSFVMTDSFHGTAFSLIFNKKFATFANSSAPYMNSRIESITDLFNCKKHFCDSEGKRTLPYIVNELSDCKCDYDMEKYMLYKENSHRFLQDSLSI